MRLARRRPAGRLISLTPLIDVMLILLVFFMVTSTYLDLDMIPVSTGARATAAAGGHGSGAPQPADAAGGALLVRVGADGRVSIRGQTVTQAALTAAIAARVAGDPQAPVFVLPSGRARAQALVSVMEAATRAGAANLRVVRLEAR